MITKTKKNILIVLLAFLFVLSLGTVGFLAVNAETPVTVIGAKAENPTSAVYAKFVLSPDGSTPLSMNAKTNVEGMTAQDTEGSYFGKVVFNLTNSAYPQFTDKQYTFTELHAKNGNWNWHIGYDSVAGVGTSTFMINGNSAYIPADGDRITLLSGLHVMNYVGDKLEYTDYVLSESVTYVYEGGAIRVLEDDEVFSISLDQTAATLNIGNELTLKANVIESVKNTPIAVEWTSSEPDVASVENGVVTAKAEGKTTITAKAGDKSVTCEITVADGTILEISDSSKEVAVGDAAFTLTATVNDGSSISWELSEEGIVSLDTTEGGTVKVTPQSIGTVTVTASANNKTAACTVSVGLSMSSVKLAVGEKATVSAGSAQNVAWSTTNDQVATVSNGEITAVGNGTATVKAEVGGKSYSVAVTVFTYKEVTFTGAELAGTNEIHVTGFSSPTDGNNFEGQRTNEEFAAFFDHFKVDGFTLNEITSDADHSDWNVNFHLRTVYLSVCLYKGATATAFPVGTQITFEKGCVLPAYTNGKWELSESRVAEDTTFELLDDGTLYLLAPEGSPAEVTAVSALELFSNYGYYEFRVTLDVLAYSGTSPTAAQDSYSLDNILIGGYTVREINEANPDAGVEIFYSNKDIIIDIYEGTEMDGAPLLDTEGHSTFFTLKEGYTTPTGYVLGADYTKYYYGGQMMWWSEAYTGKPESSQIMHIASISEISMDDDDNVAFTITFTEDVFSPTVHVNGVCSWLNTTLYAGQIDGQLTTGVKEAIWYGISVDGKTVYEYMFESGQTNDTNKSTAIQVHFDKANKLRIVFQGNLNAGFDTSAATHTVSFDAEKFYSNTGATFAMDTTWQYDTASKTWTDETEITGIAFDKTEASVEVGSTVTVTATVTGAAQADKTVTYSSSEESIATVDENGVVTGVAAGSVTITATAADGSTATCTVTVTAKEEPGENPGEKPGEDPGDTTDKGGGCSGSVASGAVVLGAFLLGAAVLCTVMLKRKD